MESFLQRLATYSSYSKRHGFSEQKLARIGLYYCRDEDSIACYRCDWTLACSSPECDPIQLHNEQSPRCPLVLNGDNENIRPQSSSIPASRSGPSVDRKESHVETEHARSFAKTLSDQFDDVDFTVAPGAKCSESIRDTLQSLKERQSRGKGYEPSSLAPTPDSTCIGTARNELGVGRESTSTAIGEARDSHYKTSESFELKSPFIGSHQVQNAQRPLKPRNPRRTTSLPYKVKHPQYEKEADRLASFANVWPLNHRSCSPEQLAKAGFFYEGPEDTVRCFCCGCGLRYFKMDDEPWKEHASYFAHCQFLVEHKLPAFIQAAQRILASLPSVTPATTNGASTNLTVRRGPGPHRVDIKDVNARMEFPRVKLILDKGYSRKLVRQAIEYRLSHLGDDFARAADLLEAVFELESEGAAEPLPPQPAQPPQPTQPPRPIKPAQPPPPIQSAQPPQPVQPTAAATNSASPGAAPATTPAPQGAAAPRRRSPSPPLSQNRVATSALDEAPRTFSPTASAGGDSNNVVSSSNSLQPTAVRPTNSSFNAGSTSNTTSSSISRTISSSTSSSTSSTASTTRPGDVLDGNTAAASNTATNGNTASVSKTATSSNTASASTTATSGNTPVASKTAAARAAFMTATVIGATAVPLAAAPAMGALVGVAAGGLVGAVAAEGVVRAGGVMSSVPAAGSAAAGGAVEGAAASAAAAAESKKAKKKNKKKNAAAVAAASAAAAEPKAAAAGQDPAEPNDPETRELMEENGQLREARTCKVCLDHEVNTVFLPCGHLVCCNTCAPELRNCPVCRALIRGTVLIVLT